MSPKADDNKPPVFPHSVYPDNTGEQGEKQSNLATPRPLVSTPEIKPDDVVILVMGNTGSAMRDFINKLTGMEPENGEGKLFSCDVGAYKCDHGGQRFIFVVFVDTPGFDNQNRSRWDEFQKIATCLEETYRRSVKLTGVIYTHSIRDNSKLADESLQLLIDLCGEEAVNQVRLVLTMCDGVEEREADDAEKTLRTQWKSLIQDGAPLERFDNDSTTAWKIIQGLGNTKKPLLIQKELVDERRALKETIAGSRFQEGSFWQVADICGSLLSSPHHPLTGTGSKSRTSLGGFETGGLEPIRR
ncbi:hypothetical protein EDC04DRAFT_3118617 [Pisolithus marmoratus]|nr:hypothetical protein EDC04DRAFT_3144223 [Pisolithus marmoratus]KAI6018348.1 hypothetical protein EDC04DRAFT_3118617 [Pisolithus marmoratus]